MQIIELKSENVKRLTAVAIKPTGPLVRISGANGSGKTSILDSLWWGLGGVGAIQSDPIRHGADKARITIRLGPHKDGDLVVKRVMTRGEDGKSVTHSLSVESGDGAKYGSPQKMLDALVDKLSFDPLDFTRVRDGSLLDSASMKIVEEMAKDREFHVWIEEVSEGDGPGILIEDGRVRGAALAAE